VPFSCVLQLLRVRLLAFRSPRLARRQRGPSYPSTKNRPVSTRSLRKRRRRIALPRDCSDWNNARTGNRAVFDLCCITLLAGHFGSPLRRKRACRDARAFVIATGDRTLDSKTNGDSMDRDIGARRDGTNAGPASRMRRRFSGVPADVSEQSTCAFLLRRTRKANGLPIAPSLGGTAHTCIV